MAEPLLTVVLPAFNEEASIGDAIDQCARLLELIPRTEVIVVDDGSTDSTQSIVEASSYEWLRLIRHEENRGYGAAIRTGFAAATGTYVFFTDSDNQFDIAEVAEHWALLEGADMLIGYRVYRYDPITRLVASWAYNRLVRVLFRVRVRDVDCSFKVMRRTKLDAVVLLSNDFFIDTEIVARARKWNWRIVEVGVKHFPRRAGRSTVRASDVPRTLRVVTQMWRQIHYPNRKQHLDAMASQTAEQERLRRLG